MKLRLLESLFLIVAVLIFDHLLVHAAAPEAAAGEGDAPSILLILDRNPISRSMLRAVLEARAGSVQFAGSAAEAIERIQAGGVAQLLIDDATIKANDDVAAALTALAKSAVPTGARTALLWPALDDAHRAEFLRTGIETLIAKPIAGAALADILYPLYKSDIADPNHLVTRAA